MVRLKRQFKFLVVLAVALTANSSSAVTSHFEQISWDSEGSIFECRLSQMLPDHGQAVFYQEAGERQQFFLDTKTALLKAGKGSLVVMGPIWKPHSSVVNLGLIPVRQSKRPVSLGAKLSSRILAELQQGRQLVISRKPWYGGPKSIQLAISPINFQGVYHKYQDCVAGLLPVNFGQVEKSILLFKGSGETLSSRQKSQLDKVVIYAKADNEVKRFYIDGHTDSHGIRAENLELSKQRAELVASYLAAAGVEKTKLITRWHGERYPVVSNRTGKGRAKNRRVTIRLEKGPELKPEADQAAGQAMSAADQKPKSIAEVAAK